MLCALGGGVVGMDDVWAGLRDGTKCVAKTKRTLVPAVQRGGIEPAAFWHPVSEFQTLWPLMHIYHLPERTGNLDDAATPET